jgi:DNA-binding NtrC family response regulator
LDAQAKLLRVLQEQEFQRVGSSETVRVDVRVIAASNVDLEQAARERRFREDLYYRLNVVPVQLPPLRERCEDIPLLLEHFLEKIRSAENAPPKHISEEAVEYLQQLDWPGNVRQLEHALQMAFAMSGDRTLLHPSDFMARRPAAAQPAAAPEATPVRVTQQGLDFDEVMSGIELSLLNQALVLSGGNKARAADLLKIKRTTLLAKMKSLAERVGPQEEKTPPRRPPASGRPPVPTVLLLNIDLPVRSWIAKILEQSGFRLLDAASPSEALELVDAWHREINILIAPVGQEDGKSTHGLEIDNLIASCRRAAPAMGFLLLSDLQRHADSVPNHARTHVLSCPFSANSLLNAVQTLTGVFECEEACA